MASSSQSIPNNTPPYVWVLMVYPPSPPGSSSTTTTQAWADLYAGALCVHPTGILVTVTHGVKPHSRNFNNHRIRAKKYGDESPVDVQLIRNIQYADFGLSLFKLSTPRTEIDCYEFSNSYGPIDVGVDVFSFPAIGRCPFCYQNGRVSYPFRGKISIPKSGRIKITSEDYLENATLGSMIDWNCFNASSGSISSLKHFKTLIGNGIRDHLKTLTPTLPFIQVSGLGQATMDGVCGCPVFTVADNIRLLGLVALSNEYYQYVIPTPIIKEVVEKNLALALRK